MHKADSVIGTGLVRVGRQDVLPHPLKLRQELFLLIYAPSVFYKRNHDMGVNEEDESRVGVK